MRSSVVIVLRPMRGAGLLNYWQKGLVLSQHKPFVLMKNLCERICGDDDSGWDEVGTEKWM